MAKHKQWTFPASRRVEIIVGIHSCLLWALSLGKEVGEGDGGKARWWGGEPSQVVRRAPGTNPLAAAQVASVRQTRWP